MGDGPMNDDAHIQRILGAHGDVVTGGQAGRGQAALSAGVAPAGHFDVDMLARHAAGQLSAARARAVTEHLLVCDDGRCVAFVRSNAEDVDAAAALLYPVGEDSMHARTFLCREALWHAFEEIAREQGAPIDDVLSEAMRSYARQRSQGGEAPNPSYMGGAPDPRAHDYHAENAPDLARTGAVRQPQQRSQGPTTEGMRRAPMPAPPPSRASGLGMPPPPMSQRGMQRPFTQPINQVPAPPQRGRPMGAPPPQPTRPPMSPSRSAPPPLPPSDPMMPAAGALYGSPRGRAATTLTLTYNGRRVDVNKERFILGRSKTQADLVLEDPNVSRQHAAIERVGSDWFLADLGSTNGCYIDGQRVSRRQIADGDVIEVTTHQVHCTLR